MYDPQLHFHFVGIGGAGMSALAEVLLKQGFRVSGSDKNMSAETQRLAELGASISHGHAAENIGAGVGVVVYSSAIPAQNPELIEAAARKLSIIKRGQLLAELMRLQHGIAVCGAHGKTTTTGLIANLMCQTSFDPTVLIGGHAKNLGSGARVGKGHWMIAEADESDRSFLLLKPSIAVVTNIEAEHMENYASFAELQDCFLEFLKNVPFYGLAILGIDCPHVRKLAARYQGRTCSYGISEDAQIRAVDVEISGRVTCFRVLAEGKDLGQIQVPFPGKHMVLNSLAAVALGLELGISFEKITESLGQYSGIKRRLEIIDQSEDCTVLSDYGHHPTELVMTIDAVKRGWIQEAHKLHVVFQPHRFTRTRDCYDQFLSAFSECDSVVLTDIYSAGESPIQGLNSKEMSASIKHPDVSYGASFAEAADLVKSRLNPGDVVLCLGAGSIGRFAEVLPGYLHGQQVEFPEA